MTTGKGWRPTFAISRAPRGFTLLELLILIVVFGLLLMMAVPALSLLAPRYMVRSTAKSMDSMMQNGRLMAYNTHKPVRLVVDCRPTRQRSASSTCTMRLYSANFNSDGELDLGGPNGAWSEIPQTMREVSNKVTVTRLEDPTNPNDLYWAVFLPTGKVKASHDPLRLKVAGVGVDVGERLVSLSLVTGRTTTKRP